MHTSQRRDLFWAIVLGLVLLFPAVGLAAKATLEWEDRSGNPCASDPTKNCQELGFYAERKDAACLSPGTWVQIGGVGSDITIYEDLTVVANGTYCYRVRAWNRGPTDAVQYSEYSNEAGITIAPDPVVEVPPAPTLAALVPGSGECTPTECSWQFTWKEPVTTGLLKTTLNTMIMSGSSPVLRVDVPATNGGGGGVITVRSLPNATPAGVSTSVQVWITATNAVGTGPPAGMPVVVMDRSAVPAPGAPTGVSVR